MTEQSSRGVFLSSNLFFWHEARCFFVDRMEPNIMPTDSGTLLFPFSASLEPPETKPQQTDILDGGRLTERQGLSERFRHSGWQRIRSLVYDSLRRTRQSVSRIVSFDSCGHAAFVYESVDLPVRYRLGGSSCRDRFCTPCARDRSRVLATNVLKALDNQPTRFLTLTLRQTTAPLSVTIDRLYSCFNKLRQRRIWRENVVGGCAFLELKWSSLNRRWNVHLHCMIHGSYIDQSRLSREWYQVTGDSKIIDIRFVKDDGKIAGYVTKYVAKPHNNTYINQSVLLDEVVASTRGRRLCFTFGDWRGMKLTESPKEGEWINLGSLTDVAALANAGDCDAIRAIDHICGNLAMEVRAYVMRGRAPPDSHRRPKLQFLFQWHVEGTACL